MGELGTRLREAREGRGLSLEQAEKVTRIRRAFLDALEGERFDELPGDVYARGFVRNYARFLGLDADQCLAAYKAASKHSLGSIPQVLDRPLMPRMGGRAWTVGFLSVVLVAAVAFGAWYAYDRYPLWVQDVCDVGEQVWSFLQAQRPPTALPTRIVLTAMPTPQVSEPIAAKEPAVVQPTTTVAETVAPTATSPIMQAESPTATSIVTRAASPTATPTATASVTPTRTVGILVEAKVVAKTYVEVTVDGTRTFTELLDAGQDRVWTAERALTLLVGNAAGLTLTVNGVPVASLGQEGEVREIKYTLDNLPRR